MRLEIEKAIYGGNGLARLPAEEGAHAGKAVFVPFTLPGETVEATLEEDHGGYATARADLIVQASSGRTVPGCRYFGVCGGCQYQHAEYGLQLEMKLGVLRETLARAGIREVPPIDALHAEQYGYRNRIRLHVELDQKNGSRIGYHARGSRKLLDVVECPIATPVLQQGLTVLRKAAQAGAIPAGTMQIELFCNSLDEVLVSLFSRTDVGAAAVSSLATLLVAAEGRIKGVCSFVGGDDRKPARAVGSWRATALDYHVGERSLRVGAASFFQTNRFLVEPLRDLVSRGRSGALAWDLYAGVGLFATALSEGFEHVIAVEAAPASVADLTHNLRGAHAKAVRATTLEFLRREAKAAGGRGPDLIVVDPPRAGLGKEITGLLSRIGAREIVYISCDPATLSRDLRPLLDCGYTARSMHLVDLFPQTFHLETVTVLDRAG
jgi:23S rRNA (uracil1939-C5)-methyltransferase